ncbi:3'-5' RNA helicase YTHDC2-like [Teleopsis dalmanni]|uniref:3'-5' RNA helicase YTHDC2-like n=1 Tax=Teleopsis dalmanni TaxID=139649 RepID=UPI0018CF2070|nr:3'-5' RNA helicase YTHDC2-like [Teleopsis dalmanni]
MPKRDLNRYKNNSNNEDIPRKYNKFSKSGMNNNRNSNKERQNLPDAERLPLEQLVSAFIQSNEGEIALPGLSNIERKYLHRYASALRLTTKSYGSKNSRVLYLTKQKTAMIGIKKKLELAAGTKTLLANVLPSLKEETRKLHSLNETSANVPLNSRYRGDALYLHLGQRLVPPRSNRIKSDMYREKQELPIYQYQDEIYRLLQTNSVIIISGDTGSGKTTQVPQYILIDAYQRKRPCRVIVTQPRRVAAVSVAHRVAEERGEQVGETVGYQIRMECRMRKTSNLIYTTSGCFLRTLMADANEIFRKTTHLIIDEVHERDKFTDFTLISVKEHLKRNKNLKLILMSATMDIVLLSRYFDNCPILRVPGQSFNVQIYYLEDILYHSGYRTALMEKYLRSMAEIEQQQLEMQQQNFEPAELYGHLSSPLEEPPQFVDNIIDQCCDVSKTTEELITLFDQLKFSISSEGLYVDTPHSETGITPLMAACKCNFPEYVEFFVKNQANVLLQDSQGYTAVEYAANFSDRACTEILERTEFCLQQQLQFTDEDVEKTQLLTAYQKQSNYDNEVDHDLILSLLEGLYRGTHPGAILVFLPGYNDIVQQRDLINSTLPPGTYKLCILHGQMDSQDQIEALQRHNQRKIILSTNIGQTSITIPDLVYIIDSGKIKMKTYDSITESSQLQSVWISKADANQRSGRAGRTQNGICYRLYSKAKYEFMPQFCIPEFMRIPLAEICLYAKTFDKNTDCQTYLQRALNPPSKVCIQNAVKKLQILQVFNDDESVTDLGKQLVEIPLDVQLGICLLYGVFFKCFDPVLTIVAYHSVKDPFLLPTDRSAQGQASYQRKLFSAQSFSDQLGVLELYKAYSTVRNNKKRCFDFCSKNSLSYSAMEMFCATRRQISDLMVQKYRLGHNATLFNDDWEMVKCCLAAGLYPNIAVLDRYKNELSSSVEKKLIVQRTSALNPPGQKNLKDFIHQLPHDWIIFYEKSRVGKLCSINMNTVISPVVVALHCGRYCNINDYGGENSDKSDDEADFEVLSKEVRDLALTDDQQTVSFILDNWIHFEMNSKDAKSLKTLRSAIKTEFITFLRRGFIESSTTAVFWLQKLLHTLDQFTIS